MPTRPKSHKMIIREVESLGYTNAKVFLDDECAAILPLMFTYAIIYGINKWGYDDRWCYSTRDAALKALNKWNGEGEPEGWHRHPSTGRRRDNGDKTTETINF